MESLTFLSVFISRGVLWVFSTLCFKLSKCITENKVDISLKNKVKFYFKILFHQAMLELASCSTQPHLHGLTSYIANVLIFKTNIRIVFFQVPTHWYSPPWHNEITFFSLNVMCNKILIVRHCVSTIDKGFGKVSVRMFWKICYH